MTENWRKGMSGRFCPRAGLKALTVYYLRIMLREDARF